MLNERVTIGLRPIGSANQIWTLEQRLSSFLRPLPQTKCCVQARCLAGFNHGKDDWFLQRSCTLLNARCAQWVRASLDMKWRLKHNGIYLKTRPLMLCAHASFATEWSKYVPTNDECYAFSGWVAVFTGASRQHCSTISFSGGKNRSCRTCISASTQHKRYPEVEDVYILYQKG